MGLKIAFGMVPMLTGVKDIVGDILREFAQTPVILTNGRAWKATPEPHFVTPLPGIPGMSSKNHSQSITLEQHSYTVAQIRPKNIKKHRVL